MIADALERVADGSCKRLMIQMPPRHGKLCADSTPVLTVQGWKRHGELRIGDFVFGPDGEPTPIIAVSSVGVASHEVELTNGDVIKCHGNHEWTVYDRRNAKWRTLETKHFCNVKLTQGKIGQRGGRYLFQLPDVSPLEFPFRWVGMDPYAFGVWLGDGSSSKPHLTMAEEDAEPVLAHLEANGYQVSARWTHSETLVPTYSFGGPKPNVSGRMHGELKAMDVLNNKHIPDAYKVASIEQKLHLIAGLVDTDGHVDRQGRVRIVTGNKRLADDIADVCTSLGFRPYITSQEPCLSSSGIMGRCKVFTVGFQPTMPLPVKIERKRIQRFGVRRRIAIKDVRLAKNPERGVCVQVARPDGLYLVGNNLTPTHNSELASRRFPAWFLGRNPNRNIIAASYNSDLATDFGREVRNIVQGQRYQNLFDVKLAADSTAANRWHTEQGGAYVAAGIGTAVTGRGAHVLLIDDPFKDREEADSEVIREKKWRWYTSTAYTRLESDLTGDVTEDDDLWLDLLEDIRKGDAEPFEGAVVVINTRWHEDDLSGRLLQQQAEGGDQWEILDLPAILGSGEALWPEKYPVERLNQIRKAIGERDWSALYQQRPAPDEGAYFKRDWFKWYTQAPTNLRIYGASDYAVTRDGGDWTVHIVCGVDEDDNIYVLDVWRSQELADESVDVFCTLVKDHKPMLWAVDRDQIVRSIGPFMRKHMRDRKAWCRVEELPMGRNDKPMRARSIQARASMGKVYLPKEAHWLGDFMGELLVFDAGKHDDQVDAFGLIGRLLDEMVPAHTPRATKPKRPADYSRASIGGGDSWRLR